MKSMFTGISVTANQRRHMLSKERNIVLVVRHGWYG